MTNRLKKKGKTLKKNKKNEDIEGYYFDGKKMKILRKKKWILSI